MHEPLTCYEGDLDLGSLVILDILDLLRRQAGEVRE